MCGIFGYIGSPDTAQRIDVDAATASLRHRGPDDRGTFRERARSGAVECAFAHCRLSIIDTSMAGHQPMRSADERYTLIYNGEIYNFRDVQRELESLGESFISHSDTEVLLKGFARWGERVVERIRGMFAFAVWDRAEGSLFLARDHFGIKPLYYSQRADGFVFASEVRTLMRSGLVERTLSRRGLASYLSFGSVYEPDTILQDVFAFPSASRGWVRDGRLTHEQYWTRPSEVDPSITFDRAVEMIRPLLRQSVQEQLVSDVPLGVFLSGGVDSSAIVALASENLGRPLKTFTVTFDEEAYNEEKYAAEVAARFGCDHHQVHLSAERAVHEIDAVLESLDQPSADGVNTWFVAKAAREAGLSVALSGTGGDELFAGYVNFRKYPRALRTPRMLSGAAALGSRLIGDPFGGVPNKIQKAIAVAEADADPSVTYAAFRAMFTRKQVQALAPDLDVDAVWKPGVANRFSSSLPLSPSSPFPLSPAGRGARGEGPSHSQGSSGSARDLVNEYSLLEQQNYLLNTLLRDTDAMSMAHSLEVRVPFLSHELAAALMHVPGSVKLGSTNKPLVTAVANRLPADVASRRKMGFTLPMEVWLRGAWRERLRDTLARPGAIVAQGAVSRLLRGFERGAEHVSWSRVWTLLTLIEWMERYRIGA